MASIRERLWKSFTVAAKAAATAFMDNSGGFNRTPITPRKPQGHSGTAVHGGYVRNNETNPALFGLTKYDTFDSMITNFSIVSGSVRYYRDLVARPTWAFEPPKDSGAEGEKYALLTEKALMHPDAPRAWYDVVRYAATYKLYGFSTQEWELVKREGEDFYGLDLWIRPQRTITRFDVQPSGKIIGFGQQSPWDGSEHYLRRGKLLYLADNALTDSPEGLGLLRQVVAAATRLQRYEQLEGFNYETELKGMPVGRAPIQYLNQLVDNGDLTEEEAKALVAPLKNIIENHIRTPELGILLDSMVYESVGSDTVMATNNKMYDLDIIKGEVTANGSKNIAEAIKRMTWDIARVFGTESMLLGSDGKGTYALSEDKTNNLLMLVDGVLLDIAAAVHRDVITPLFRLNQWPMKYRPRPVTDSSQYRNVKEITAALLDLAKAGYMLTPDNKAIPVVYRALGLPRPPEINVAADAALRLTEAQADAAEAGAEATRNPPKDPNKQPAKPASGSQKKMKAYKGSSHCIMLEIPAEECARLAVPGGETPSDLHITLAYLGKGLSLEQMQRVNKVVRGLAQDTITADIGDLGTFEPTINSEGRRVYYAKVQSVALMNFRKVLVDALDVVGIKVASNFEYTPHVTLAYMAEELPYLFPAPEVRSIVLDRLTYKAGVDGFTYQLGVEREE